MDQKRMANIELLRIIAMLMIISTHCLGSINVGAIPKGSVSYYGILLVQTISVYGVNLFVLITGYFMVMQKSVSIKKVITLLLDVAIYGLIIYVISIFLEINSFSVAGVIKAVFPFIAGYRWFIVAYVILYMLIPFINTALRQLTFTQYQVLLVIFFFFFSVWPSFFPNPPLDDYGYSFYHLIFVYIIGGYIRVYGRETQGVHDAVILMAMIAATTLLQALPLQGIPVLSTAKGYALANNSIFVIVAAVALFKLFLKCKVQQRIIFPLAASAFAVFLIHGDYNIMGYLFNDMLNMSSVLEMRCWIIIYPIIIISIYVICAIIDMGKRYLLNKSISSILAAIPLFNYRISTKEE